MRPDRPTATRPRQRRRPLALIAVLVALAAGVASGCSGSDGAAADDELTVTDATIDWPANPDVAAVRLTITNGTDTDDVLTGATSDVGEATIHQSATDDQDRSVMKPLESLHIPAGETVAFEAGNRHIMIDNPDPPLEVGDTVAVTLEFSKAGSRTVQAKVIEPGSRDDMSGMEGHDG